MFKKLLSGIKRAMGDPTPVDPSVFNDPVAMRTAWHPARGGGTNFRTHKLVVTGPERVEFRASVGARLFYGCFLLAGLGVLIGIGFDAKTVLPLAIGSLFTTVGGLLWYFGTTPIVFDRRKEYFWKGRKVPDLVFDKSRLKHFATFEDIHALQLIAECCHGDKSSFYSYELNLVLEDGKRINVIDHGNLSRIQEDAQKLAEFLDKPLWNAI